MSRDTIGEWIEHEFGVRDERLFDVELRKARIEALEEEHAMKYERARSKMEALDGQFRKTLQAASDADEHGRDQYKQKAKKIKRNYETRSDERDRHGRRLAATLVVRSFLDVGDEEPEVVQERIVSELNDSKIENQDTNDYLVAVVEALDVDERYFPDWLVDSETPSGPIGFPTDVSSVPVQLDSIDSDEPSDPEIDWDLNQL